MVQIKISNKICSWEFITMVKVDTRITIRDNSALFHRVKRNIFLDVVRRESNKLIEDLNKGRHTNADWEFRLKPITIKNDQIIVDVYVHPPERILAALGQEFGIKTDMIRPRYRRVLAFPDRWGIGYLKEESTEPMVFRKEVKPSPRFYRPHIARTGLAFVRRIDELSKHIAKQLGSRKV